MRTRVEVRNTVAEMYDEQKENVKEYKELFIEIHTEILKRLKEEKLVISNYEFTDGYFIFYHGEGSICHFTIKQAPAWKFGIWLSFKEKEEPEEPNEIHYQIFAQPIKFIDKFKPSASTYLAEGVFLQEELNDMNGDFIGYSSSYDIEMEMSFIVNKLKMTWEHTYLAIYRDISFTDYNEEFVRPITAFFRVKRAYLQDYLYSLKRKRANKVLLRKLPRWFKRKLKKYKEYSFEIIDEGENVYPRYHPKVTLDQSILTKEFIEKFEKQYNNQKDKLLKKRTNKGSFGWIEWYEFTDEVEQTEEKE